MWHLFPEYKQVQSNRQIWRADKDTKLIPTLAISALLTEGKIDNHQAQQYGFWGDGSIGSALADYLRHSFIFNDANIQKLRQEILLKLQFLYDAQLAQSIAVNIEATAQNNDPRDRQHHIIRIIIDKTSLEF